MRTKGRPPLEALRERRPAAGLPSLIEAYFELNQLKRLYRQGWLRRGVPPEQCESVADHVFAMAMLGWWVADAYYPDLDRDRVLRMTLAHELGEIYAGDLTPSDGVLPEEKERREREALRLVTGRLPRGADILGLWEEYARGETAEARFVRQIDRLEMAFQAAVYTQDGFKGMEEFFASAGIALSEPVLAEILKRLEELSE